MRRNGEKFCIKRFTRELGLQLLKPAGLFYLFKQKSLSTQGVSSSSSHHQYFLLWQLMVVCLVVAAVLVVSANLNDLPSGMLSIILVGITVLLFASAMLARLRDNRGRADRLFAWTTLVFAFASAGLALQMGWIDFIPDSLWLWVSGGLLLSLVSWSRVPLLFTQVILMAWMYTHFLYGFSLWPALPVIGLCALIIATARVWREQFILLMLNIVTVFNLLTYDAIHGNHFPLQLARDHVGWTLTAVLMLAILGAALLHTPKKSWQQLGAAGLFVASVVYVQLLLLFSFALPWNWIFSLPMQAQDGVIGLLSGTVVAGLLVFWMTGRLQGSQMAGQSRWLMLALCLVASFMVIRLSGSAVTVPSWTPLLVLSISAAWCFTIGLKRNSSLWSWTGATLILLPLLSRLMLMGTEGRALEFLIAAAILALSLLLSPQARYREVAHAV